MSKRVFLAAPISGFPDPEEYYAYRDSILKLIARLRANSLEVFSEVERIGNTDSYDSPGQSALQDFQGIDASDIFLMLHPRKLQTSSLIELGYACAREKAIMIVGPRRAIPYLALGLPEINPHARIIESDNLDIQTINTVVSELTRLAAELG